MNATALSILKYIMELFFTVHTHTHTRSAIVILRTDYSAIERKLTETHIRAWLQRIKFLIYAHVQY